MTIAELVQHLSGVRQISGGWTAKCPAHEDKHPSLSVSQGDNGTLLLHCHAGCSVEQIVKAIGIEIKDCFADSGAVAPRSTPERPKPEKPAVPPLSDSQVQTWRAALRGDPDAWRYATEVLRFSPEAIERYGLGLQVDRNGRRWLMYPYRRAGVWTYAKGRSIDGDKAFLREPRGQASHPYGADDLEPGGTAIVVEGERDALAAWTLGLQRELGGEAGAALVSLPDGAKPKPGASVVAALKEQRRIYVVTDADDPGDAAAAGLAEELGAKCVRVRLEEHKDLGDLLAEFGPEMGADAALQAFRRADEKGQDPTGARAMLRSGIVRFTVNDLLSPPPKQQFILHPYIPAGVVTTLAGPGGSNKTTLLTYLAVCRALGRPFFGDRHMTRGKTVILTTEDGREDYWRKLAGIREHLGDEFDAAAVAENVILLDMAGIPVRLVEAERGNWRPTETPDHLAAVLKTDAAGADLVIMETVSRLVGGVETNESLSILVESAQRLCRLAGVAVVLVAHVSQEAGRQGYADAYAPRGGSALGDNGRSTMVLTRINENNKDAFCDGIQISAELMERLLVLTHPKSNGAPSAKPLLLERLTTSFGPVLTSVRARMSPAEDVSCRLVRQVKELAARGTPATRRSLRDYTDEIGVGKKRLDRVVNDALRSGLLEEQRNPGRGGGVMLMPSPKGTEI